MIELLVESKKLDGDQPQKPLVIAYYTMNTPYEAEAEVLRLSLESLGYGYHICGVENLGSWQKNTQYKSRFVQHLMVRHSGMPLLYLDVDAIMVQPPILLDNIDADIAAVHFAHRNELLSGTVYFGGTDKCHEIVETWIQLNEKYPVTLPDGREAWDQRTLEMAIKQVKGVKFVELPQEYTWITELTQKYRPGLSPVIMHTRGAKRFKNRIDGKEGYAK